MFVRKDRNGNLVAVGSIDVSRLAQLRQAKPRKSASKATASADPVAEPEVVPKPAVKSSGSESEFKSALDV